MEQEPEQKQECYYFHIAAGSDFGDADYSHNTKKKKEWTT